MGLVFWAWWKLQLYRYSRYVMSTLCITSQDYLIYVIALKYMSKLLIVEMNSWLTLAIAVTRYVVISRVSFNLTTKHVRYLVMFSAIISILHFIPDALTEHIASERNETTNQTCYHWINFYDKLISKKTFGWFYLIFDSTPVLLLAVFSILLVRVIYKGRRRHYAIASNAIQSSTWNKTTRTTVILIAISVMSILARLRFLWSYIEECIITETNKLHRLLRDILLALSLINSSVNILFFLISKDFKNTLKNIELCRYFSPRYIFSLEGRLLICTFF